MKIFTFILAFTVLALSLIPCMDSVSITNLAHTELSTASQHEHTQKDDCSPFCTCSCCSVSFINHTSSYSGFDKPYLQIKNYSAYKASFYATVSLAIWQPPKLS